MTMHHGFAFDRGSVRSFSADGRLHVETSHISMEQVADYLGREIPNWKALGLEERKVYRLYRSAAELKKAASTFNMIPVLTQHVPVTAADHRPELVVGATGTDATFRAPYLDNSMVIWSDDAIELIESETQKELSCAYRYTPVIEAGTFNGQPYDIRMVDLVANHVALVAAGRAGPTVVVGDSLPKELQAMKKPSRMALLARGALMALAPQLASDAKLDLNGTLSGVTAANWLKKKPAILASIKPKLAADADVGHLVSLLDSLDTDAKAGDDTMGNEPDPAAVDPNAPVDVDKKLDAIDADPCADLMAMLAGKLSPEDLAAFEAKLRAALTPVGTDGETTPINDINADPAKLEEADMVSKPAMDAAIAASHSKAIADGRRIAREITEAEKIVRPYVGELVAMDSAEAVFKAALEVLEISTEKLHPSAYRAVLEAQPRPGSTFTAPAIAMDSRVKTAAKFPDIARIRIHG